MSMVPQDTWPIVLPNDDGIRPAGKPDECFYCNQKVGMPHLFQCVCVNVLVGYDVEAELPDGRVFTGKWERFEPISWAKEVIESHKNKSTWCAINADVEWDQPEAQEAIDTLIEYDENKEVPEGKFCCACGLLTFEVREWLDRRPHITLRDPNLPKDPDVTKWEFEAKPSGEISL